MTQRYDQDNILGYVEGELTDDQRAQFEALLADDHELRQLVSQMKLDRQALRGLGAQPAPVGLIDQVIQVHERAALLGDPAAPEPLPLSMPVSRWKLRRVVAYSGVAAIVLLSFGLVLQTLVPPGLLNHSSKLAKNQTGPGAPDTPGHTTLDVGSGVALLDEDEVYDQPDARALGFKTSDPIAGQGKSVASARTTVPRESELDGSIKSESFALAEESVEADAGPVVAGDTSLPESALALAPTTTGLRQDAEVLSKQRGAFFDEGTPGQSLTQAETKSDDTADAGGLLARAETPETTETPVAVDSLEFKKDEPADAFAGYAGITLTDRTQLVVNAPSPTQARRDIRDWATANSVRFVEQPYPVTNATREAAAPPARAGALSITAQDKPVQGRRARAMATKTTAEVAGGSGGAFETGRYIVIIDQHQVPDLLAHLNQTDGQRAELITPHEEARANEQPPRLGATLTQTLTSRDNHTVPAEDTAPDPRADKADSPKAVANRLVDTQSGWDNGSLVRGISPSAENNRAKDTKQADARSAGIARGAQEKQKEETPKEQSLPSIAFDWSRLLEPRKPFTAPAATEAKQNDSEARAEFHKQVRLEIIIQQVADGVEVDRSGIGADAELEQTEQAQTKENAEQ